MRKMSLAKAIVMSTGGIAAGLVLGRLYFRGVQRTAELYGVGRRVAPSALMLGRLAGAIAFFSLVARFGALPLLSALLGFLLARKLALRAARSSA
jgi:N-ATPase, AtpR subunit